MRLSELDWNYVDERAAHFTGREWAFERLAAFLRGPEGVLLLSGGPGTGKTAVAAQLAQMSAGRLAPDRVGEAVSALQVDAAYFCQAGKVGVADVAQRLCDQLAEAVPQFTDILRARLAPEIQIREVQVHTGAVAAGAEVAGVRIVLGGEPESAFLQGVTVPLKRLREAGVRTRVVLLVDALDESLTSPAADALPRLLGAVEHVHLIVTSRDDPRAVDELRGQVQVVNLVADAPAGSDDVLAYLYHRLDRQGAPGAMTVLARRIARQAAGNFLYAYYVVEALISAGRLGGLDEPTAHRVRLPEGGLPAIYREFLQREVGGDRHAWRESFRPVLGALAVAQDEGLNTDQLAQVASRLRDQPMKRQAVRDVTDAAWQFLDGVHPDGPFRMYHQSFADFLVDTEHNPRFLVDLIETHAAIVGAYASTDPLTWDLYARRNLATHAAAAGQLDGLLTDPGFLVAADPARLLRALPAASISAGQVAGVYRLAAYQLRDRPVEEAAAYLELAARQQRADGLADRIRDLGLAQPWSVLWATWQPASAHRIAGRHAGRVFAVAVAELDGQPIAVSGGTDGTVRIWDLRADALIGEPLTGHSGWVNAVAVGELDGRPIAVSGGADSTVRIWDLRARAPLGAPLTGHSGWVFAVAVGELDGRPIAVSGGADSTVRIWDLRASSPIGEPLTSHNDQVLAVAVGELDSHPIPVSDDDGTVRIWDLRAGTLLGEQLTGDYPWPILGVAVGELDGRPIAVSGGADSTVRIWDLRAGSPIGTPLTGHNDQVLAVAVGELDGRPIAVSGGADSTVRIWDLRASSPIGEPLTSHNDQLFAVAVGELDGRPIAVSGGTDGTVRIWDLRADALIGEPLTGHSSWVFAVAVGELDGRPIAVGGGADSSVRVWDLGAGSLLGEQLTGDYPWPILGVAVGELDGRPIAVSGGADSTVRIWDLRAGSPIGTPLTGHNDQVLAVAVGELDGRPIAVSGGTDRTVRIWDLRAGSPIGEPLTGHNEQVDAVAVAELDGRPIAVSCDYDDDGTVRVWDLRTGTLLREDLTGDYFWAVLGVAVGELDGRPIAVTSGADRTVRIWDLSAGSPIGEPLTSHSETLEMSVALGELDGRPIAVTTGGREGTVQVWDLRAGAPLGAPLTGHSGWVNAVAVGELDGRPIAVSGGLDRTVRVWDLRTRRVDVIEIGAGISAIAYVPSSKILVATDRGVTLLQLRNDPRSYDGDH